MDSEWAHLLATEEEIAAGLQELKERGGAELHEFIGELEQALRDHERAGPDVAPARVAPPGPAGARLGLRGLP